MTKQKIGLILFWIGVIWAIVWGSVIGFLSVGPAYRYLTMAEINQTIWKSPGFWTSLWGLGVPLGAIVIGVGLLIYSSAKRSTVWKFGIITFIGLVLVVTIMNSPHEHFPPLFGIGGTLILLFFTGIGWFWVKDRKVINDTLKPENDLKFVGYVFLLMATWFTCGIASIPFIKAMKGIPPSSPIHIIILFVLGWLFLFLGHYKSFKNKLGGKK